MDVQLDSGRLIFSPEDEADQLIIERWYGQLHDPVRPDKAPSLRIEFVNLRSAVILSSGE